MSHPTLEKYRVRLVTVRAPGLRGKRTGWVIDEDDESYDWRSDLGDAEDQVDAGELLPIVYLGEVDDGELVEGEGFLLLEPESQDLFLVDEGSLDEEPRGSLDELVLTPIAGLDDDDDEDEDYDVDDDDDLPDAGDGVVGDDDEGDAEASDENE